MAIRIITDSTSDLPAEIVKSLEINIVSLYVSFGEESFKGVDINNDDFYKKMEVEGIPVSSQPSVGDMVEIMEKTVKTGDELICVFLSSDLSGTFQNAQLAKTMILENYSDARIALIDSQSTSMAMGFAVIAGARMAKAGQDFEAIIKEIELTIQKSRFIFIPHNLDYLHKGGRIGGAGKLFGNILKITPILTIKDKKIEILQTVRTKTRAKENMIKELMKDHAHYGVEEVVIHHINVYEEALQLYKKLKDKLDCEISIQDIGPVIGLHVGPGSIGLAYRTKKIISN